MREILIIIPCFVLGRNEEMIVLEIFIFFVQATYPLCKCGRIIKVIVNVQMCMFNIKSSYPQSWHATSIPLKILMLNISIKFTNLFSLSLTWFEHKHMKTKVWFSFDKLSVQQKGRTFFGLLDFIWNVM